jgi:UDP-N-acetylmuramoyl-L-alanyl-D-glutamate--2,6-diaminopimelate ligase
MSHYFSKPAVLNDEMKTKNLFKGIINDSSVADIEIHGISCDSRKTKKGDLFVAVSGAEQDGHQFVPDAVKRGASLLVVGKDQGGAGVPQVIVENPREVLPRLASRYYGEPSLEMALYGVTGTNGKTTLTFLMESILIEAGRIPGVFGTVNYRFGGKAIVASTTTPGPIDLQYHLRAMKKAKVTDVVMEVSSHALVQERVAEIHFDGVAFTNLSWDHLDYHNNLDDYFKTKTRLFSKVLPRSQKKNKFAVINMEDPRGKELLSLCSDRVLRVALKGEAEILAETFEITNEGIKADILVEGKRMILRSPLLGRFNLENILVAIGLAHGAGVSLKDIRGGIEKLKFVPGRLEPILNPQGFHVYVDYAHTPQALAGVGQALKEISKGRILTVFGCGGDRDVSKRPEMGKEVARFSDVVIVTSDNPRTESPEKIMNEITPGLKIGGAKEVCRIADRKKAIEKAVSLARSGDTILVAGKGHEDYQILGKKKIHFSDAEILREILG